MLSSLCLVPFVRLISRRLMCAQLNLPELRIIGPVNKANKNIRRWFLQFRVKNEKIANFVSHSTCPHIDKQRLKIKYVSNLGLKDLLKPNFRGVVHSQIGCTDFKSSKTNFRIFSDFLDFSDFSGFFGVYEDFMNKKNIKH